MASSNNNTSSSSSSNDNLSPLSALGNNNIYAQAMNNLGTLMNATLPKQVDYASTLPDASVLNTLRQNALMGDIVGAGKIAEPGYASGMDQAQLAGLQQLAGYNPLQGMAGIATTPTVFAPMVQQAQQQAEAQRDINKQQGLAGLELGATAKDYLNSLAPQIQQGPGAISPSIATGLGQYAQGTQANANINAENIIKSISPVIGGDPTKILPVAGSIYNNYLKNYGLNGAITNPYTSGEQGLESSTLGEMSPVDKQQYLQLKSEIAPGLNITGEHSRIQNAADMQNFINNYNEYNNDWNKTLPNVQANISNIQKILSDPSMQSEYAKAIANNRVPIAQSSWFSELSNKLGVASSPAMVDSLKALVSNQPQLVGLMNGDTKNIPALKQALNQYVGNYKSQYYRNALANDVLSNVQANPLLKDTVSPTQYMNAKINNIPYLNPQSPISQKPFIDKSGGMKATKGQTLTVQDAYMSAYNYYKANGQTPSEAKDSAANYIKTNMQ